MISLNKGYLELEKPYNPLMDRNIRMIAKKHGLTKQPDGSHMGKIGMFNIKYHKQLGNESDPRYHVIQIEDPTKNIEQLPIQHPFFKTVAKLYNVLF